MKQTFCIDHILPRYGSVALVAYDAGAAAHIASWFSSSKKNLILYAEGPAKKLFEERLQHQMEESLASAIDKSSLVVTGTGWASDLEHRARQLAAVKNIPSVAVLDHWVNYPERFSREGRIQFPSELWVADAEARALAFELFPKLPVQHLPNYWLENLCSKVRKIRCRNGYLQPRIPARRLLYLLEPIRVSWTDDPATLMRQENSKLCAIISQLPLLIERFCGMTHQLECMLLRPHLQNHRENTMPLYRVFS